MVRMYSVYSTPARIATMAFLQSTAYAGKKKMGISLNIIEGQREGQGGIGDYLSGFVENDAII